MGSFKRPIYVALFRRDCSRSMQEQKVGGREGPYCLTPLLQWIVFPRTSLWRTFDVPE